MNHLDLAKLCQATYGNEPPLPTQSCNGVVWAAQGDVIAFRGSESEQDWLRDFEAETFNHPQLGKVESGFFEGIQQTFAWMVKNGPKNPVFTGHSLGGAHAAIMAALYEANDYPWQGLVTFGCPRPGYAQLRDLLCGSGKPMTAYRNGKDIVPTVPRAFLWWSYRTCVPWTHIGEGDDPFSDHLIARYIEALG